MNALDDRMIEALEWALAHVTFCEGGSVNPSLLASKATLTEAKERRAREEAYWESKSHEDHEEFTDPFAEAP